MGNQTQPIALVQIWLTRPGGSLAAVIPRDVRHALNVNRGDRFLVKTDGENRIIYERVHPAEARTDG